MREEVKQSMDNINHHLGNLKSKMLYFGLYPKFDFDLKAAMEKGKEWVTYEYRMETYNLINEWCHVEILEECEKYFRSFKNSLEPLYYIDLKTEDRERYFKEQLKKIDDLLKDFIECGYGDFSQAYEFKPHPYPFEYNSIPYLSWKKRYLLRYDFTKLLIKTREEILQYVEVKQPTETTNSENEESRTKPILIKYFNGIKDCFQRKEDYNLFIDILTNFFEYKPYEFPNNPIELKRGSKTKVFAIFNPIHKELSNKDALKTDVEYFEIIRLLSPYRDLADIEIYKGITR